MLIRVTKMSQGPCMQKRVVSHNLFKSFEQKFWVWVFLKFIFVA